MNWHALDIDLQPEAREAVEYALMEAGALGTETTDDTHVTAYFSETPSRELVREKLFEALRIYSLPSSAVRDMNLRDVADRDWLEEWKKSWQPVEVGRFIIAPPWARLDDVPDRIIIRIEPGMAFGTGTHETTRLCLDAIQRYFSGGSFVDVGTGTGILAIAAAKLLPGARVTAYDTDEEAIEIARANAAANGLAGKIEFCAGTIDDKTASADLVCANLTASVILEMLPALIGVTCGKLVLSGILETQIEPILAALPQSEVQIKQIGEWIAIIT